MGISSGVPSIIRDGLLYIVDANDNYSYPHNDNSGSLWRPITFDQPRNVIVGGTSKFEKEGNNRYMNFDGASGFYYYGSHYWTNPAPYVWNLMASITTEITLEIWTRPTNVYNGWYRGIVSYWNTNRAGFQFELFQGTNDIKWAIGDGVNGEESLRSKTFTENQWHHVVGTYKASEFLRFYQNGQVIQSKTSPYTTSVGSPPTYRPFVVGAMSYGGYSYNGDIGLVRIYNKALTDDEIAYHYRISKGRFGR